MKKWLLTFMMILSGQASIIFAINQEHHEDIVKEWIPQMILITRQDELQSILRNNPELLTPISEQDKKERQILWSNQSSDSHQGNFSSEAVLSNAVSQYLKKAYKAYEGLFLNMIVLNPQGLVIGATHKPHHYDRKNEDKFVQAVKKGPNGVYISPYHFSQELGQSLFYVSIHISDENLNSYGVLLIGVDKDMLKYDRKEHNYLPPRNERYPL